jgi:hypothetical protein
MWYPPGIMLKWWKESKWQVVGFLCHIMPSATGITGIPHMGHCSGGNVADSSDIDLEFKKT